MTRFAKELTKKVIAYFNCTAFKYINRTRFRIPVIKKIGLQHFSVSEKWMVGLLEIFIKERDGLFVDVGVNLGQTLLKLKSIDKEYAYIGFEPNPVCVFYVEELIRVNKLTNCSLFPIAIGTQTHLAELYIHDSTDTAGSSATTLRDFKNAPITFTKYIPVFPLSYFEDKTFAGKKIDILKIDVEGAELEVIEGSLEVIKKHQPVVFIELLPSINQNTRQLTSGRKAKIQQIMEGIDYGIFRITKNKSGNFAGLWQVRDIVAEIEAHRHDWDYLMAPRANPLTVQHILNPD